MQWRTESERAAQQDGEKKAKKALEEFLKAQRGGKKRRGKARKGQAGRERGP